MQADVLQRGGDLRVAFPADSRGSAMDNAQVAKRLALRFARLRPCCVEFERCRNVRLEDFRIRESPLWCIHLRLCEDVTVRGVDIRARGHNNDGIDINASRRTSDSRTST